MVVKRLKPANEQNNTSTELIAKLFKKEAAVLEELGNGSSQIPKLYGYFSENDKFYLVQEYVKGISLSQAGKITPDQAKTILLSLLETLKYIHSKGIIHRDIKPENIILRDGDQLPVLIDFGALKETMGVVTLGSGSTVSSMVIGTRGFMAPEQSAGRSMFSTDLYALGLTIIYALTQKLPIEFATSQLTGELDWESDAPNIDPGLAKVLEKAIQMELNRRYAMAEEMYQDVQSLHIYTPQLSSSMETVRVLPNNDYVHSASSNSTAPTVVFDSDKFYPQENKSSNNALTIIAILVGAVIIAVGVGGGIFMIYQIKKTEARIAQVEKEKQQVELKRIEVEQKVAEETKRQQELEQQRIEQERQKLAEEKQRLERQRAESVQSTRPSAADFIRNHYANLDAGDYSNTWDRLSSNFTSSLSYADYTDWWNNVAEIRLQDASLISQNDSNARVKVNLSYVMNDGRVVWDQKPFINLVWDNYSDEWLIDSKN
ncbi:eukaryotic protein kinase [Synechocystis sp. PCC 6714]|nr:eukaryotic protein kinase [Synechocystis sp. PCC 6714]